MDQLIRLVVNEKHQDIRGIVLGEFKSQIRIQGLFYKSHDLGRAKGVACLRDSGKG